jgi:hypothetical protein
VDIEKALALVRETSERVNTVSENVAMAIPRYKYQEKPLAQLEKDLEALDYFMELAGPALMAYQQTAGSARAYVVSTIHLISFFVCNEDKVRKIDQLITDPKILPDDEINSKNRELWRYIKSSSEAIFGFLNELLSKGHQRENDIDGS